MWGVGGGWERHGGRVSGAGGVDVRGVWGGDILEASGWCVGVVGGWGACVVVVLKWLGAWCFREDRGVQCGGAGAGGRVREEQQRTAGTGVVSGMGVREQVAGFVFAVATDRLCEGQAEGGWGIGDADVAAVASPAFWGAERAEDIPRGAEEADNVGSRGERGRGGEREHVSEGVRVSGVLAIFEFPLSVHAREVAAGEFEVVSVARGRGVLQGVEARADGVPVGGCGDEGAVGDGVGAQSDPRGGGEFLGEVSAAAVEVGDEVFLGRAAGRRLGVRRARVAVHIGEFTGRARAGSDRESRGTKRLRGGVGVVMVVLGGWEMGGACCGMSGNRIGRWMLE